MAKSSNALYFRRFKPFTYSENVASNCSERFGGSLNSLMVRCMRHKPLSLASFAIPRQSKANVIHWVFFVAALPGVFPGLPSLAQSAGNSAHLELPSSKILERTLIGSPSKTNSLPMSLVLSPNGRYAAALNAGSGTAESDYDQSVLIVDLTTGKQVDFPDTRTQMAKAHQTLYQGLAWSSDGKHLYASFASLTAPDSEKPDDTGNAIAVYGFEDGKLIPERLIRLPLQRLAEGKQQSVFNHSVKPGMAIPYPSGLCVVAGLPGIGDRLLVADNLSDNALLINAGSGKILTRYDLSISQTVPAAYPFAVTATRDGKRGFVTLWNGSAVAEIDLVHGRVLGRVGLLGPTTPISPGSLPTALTLSPNEKHLYVALANRDMTADVAVSSSAKRPSRVAGFFDSRLPGQTYLGAVPDAVAVSPDGRRLFVANAGSDAVAIYDTAADKAHSGKLQAAVRPLGFIPTGWLPTAIAATPRELLIATGKDQGTGPNDMPQPNVRAGMSHYRHSIIRTLLYGSFARVPLVHLDDGLADLTADVITDNRMNAAQEKIAFHKGTNPIRHIVYIIKENKTYDDVFGDEAAANGDPTLTEFGRGVTPNEHKLAEQFGILDGFYDSGEVSGNGHAWSNAATSSDYTERTWQQSYRGERPYDYEGTVGGGYPILQGIPDVNEPGSGYLWGNLARHGKNLYHFGEFIATKYCTEKKPVTKQGSRSESAHEPTTAGCNPPAIHKGEAIPANYGGGISPYPWTIPMIASNIATKPELQGHFDPNYPDFALKFPDQLRVNEFLSKFRGWVSSRAAGVDDMPDFIQLRLGNDHTAGTTAGYPTPAASVADNDLAVGRVVEAISHSSFWNDTAFFILEDDPNGGADHVDAHRSICLVISKYSPRPENAVPFVDHRFYTTVSTIRTMENLMGIPPMNNNDAFAPLMAPLFSGDGEQPAYTVDYRNRDNGMIYEENTTRSPGARESARMDFSHADQAPSAELADILWRAAMGNKPLPPQLLQPALHPQKKDGDGD